MKTTLAAGAAMGAILVFGAGAAHADPAADTAKLQAQLQALQAQVQALQAQVNQGPVVTNASLGDLDAAQTPGGTGPVNQSGTQGDNAGPAFKFDGATRATDGQGDMFKVRGRILFDAVSEDVDREGGSARVPDFHSRNFRGRQEYLGVEGQIGPNFAYKLEGGWANGSVPNWDDAVIEYKVSKTASVLFGNQKAAGLENITSQRFTDFLDRGVYSDITQTGYVVAVESVITGPNYSIWAAVQGNSLNSTDVTQGAYGSNSANERVGFTFRGTYSPILTADTKSHLAAWVRYRSRGGENGFAYNAYADTNYQNEVNSATAATLLNTGAVGNSDVTVGGEAMFEHRQYEVQAEAAAIFVDRINATKSPTLGYTGSGGDFTIPIGYVSASYFLTGEMKNYNVNGQFGRVKVLNPIDKGGTGAFQLVARYDFADFTDMKRNTTSSLASQVGLANAAVPTAGIATAGVWNGVTVGLNWYPISYVRFMGNYTYGAINNRQFNVPATATGTTNVLSQADAKVNVFQLRAQLDF